MNIAQAPSGHSRPYSHEHGYTPECGVDYMTFSTTSDLDLVLDLLHAYLEGKLQFEDHGTRFYRKRWTGPFGVSVKSEPKMGRKHVNVNLTGETCEKLGFERLYILTCSLENVNLSRLDLKIDHCPFTPWHVHDTFMSGQTNTHVQRKKGSVRYFYGLEDEPFDSEALPELDSTCYIGSPSSDTMWRCYDMHRTEEGYRITRLEQQMRRKRADSAWWALVNEKSGVDMETGEVLYSPRAFEQVEADFPAYVVGVMTGHCDFVDRDSDVNVSRCDRIDWWAELVEDTGRVRFPVDKRLPSIEKAVEWARVMAGAFATYACAHLASRGQLHTYIDEDGKVALLPDWYGDGRLILAEFLRHGLSRMKGKHWGLVQSVRPGMVL